MRWWRGGIGQFGLDTKRYAAFAQPRRYANSAQTNANFAQRRRYADSAQTDAIFVQPRRFAESAQTVANSADNSFRIPTNRGGYRRHRIDNTRRTDSNAHATCGRTFSIDKCHVVGLRKGWPAATLSIKCATNERAAG